MAQEGAHIYRNPNGMLGGVCSGIAERLDFDVALVRLLVVVLTVLTAGAFALVYLAVWLILPIKPSQENTVDVDPASFQSDVYEQVVNATPPAPQTQNVNTAIHPVPPAPAAAYYQNASRTSNAGPTPSSTYSSRVSPKAASGTSSKAAPGASKPLTTGFSAGILIICVALIALSSALGIFTVDMNAWVTQAGPFLLIAVGLFIMGRASKTNTLIVCAGFALVAFLIVGAYFSLHEGPLELGVSLPFSPDSILERK